jgi:hypothetical protein
MILFVFGTGARRAELRQERHVYSRAMDDGLPSSVRSGMMARWVDGANLPLLTELDLRVGASLLFVYNSKLQCALIRYSDEGLEILGVSKAGWCVILQETSCMRVAGLAHSPRKLVKIVLGKSFYHQLLCLAMKLLELGRPSALVVAPQYRQHIAESLDETNKLSASNIKSDHRRLTHRSATGANRR